MDMSKPPCYFKAVEVNALQSMVFLFHRTQLKRYILDCNGLLKLENFCKYLSAT